MVNIGRFEWSARDYSLLMNFRVQIDEGCGGLIYSRDFRPTMIGVVQVQVNEIYDARS